MKKIPYFIIMFLGLALTIAISQAKQVKQERDKYKNNQATLLDDIERYKLYDSINVAHIKELTLSKSELERYRAEDAALIKHLKSVDKTTKVIPVTMHTTDTIEVPIVDTVIINKPYKKFHYLDNWNVVDGLVDNDSVKLNINTKNELLITEHIKRKKFLFIKLPIKMFGYKHESLSVISKNPTTTITDVQYIKVE